MKKYRLSIIVFVLVLGVVWAPIHASENEALSEEERGTIHTIHAIIEAIHIAEKEHYKPIEDRNEMFRGAIKGALASLNDPYTYYISKKQQQRAQENLYNAQFGGLGIHIYVDPHGFLKISKPLANTPAARANLQAGDTITKVNDTSILLTEKTGLTLLDVVDLLRGEIGTDVTITVQRNRLEPFDVTLRRARIPIESVQSTMLDGNIGYIRITAFIGSDLELGTYAEFSKALAGQKASGMNALILDLRDNSGGLLNAAYRVADTFVDEGIIVSTKRRNGDTVKEFGATPLLLCPQDIPLVVLVNEYSASAAEIVAAAIKETRRGILVGQKTYGKGVVQRRYPLKDGGALSLTISSYYTPNGTAIHDVGITPNVAVEPEVPNEIEQLMLQKMDANGELATFVDKWIDDQQKQTAEMPKDFALLEAALPKFQQTLQEEGVLVSLRSLKRRAEPLFNRQVGIQQVVNVDDDRQLQEAICILKAGDWETYLQTPQK